jgi:curved DNA-binding protein CbpA
MASNSDTAQKPRRKHPRHNAPKGLFVGWKSASQRTVSRAGTIGMGGLYLYTPDPPSLGSIIELLFDLKAGEVRARAIVRHREPSQGMGVQFVQMQAADRARLNQFLSRYIATQPSPPRTKPDADSPDVPPPASKIDEGARFQQELVEVLDMAVKGTYYQLLGVSPDADPKQIKQSFYTLARKFHPDHHMDRPELMGRLKQLTSVATIAYKTLADAKQRAEYDAQLAASGTFRLGRAKTASQETAEQCFARATECLRSGNFVGSIVWLRKCAEFSPNEARYHALLARSLSSVAQYRDESIQEFQRAIELDPWNMPPYLQLAQIYESMQLPSRATLLYSKVLEMNPAHSEARERLTQLEKGRSAARI